MKQPKWPNHKHSLAPKEVKIVGSIQIIFLHSAVQWALFFCCLKKSSESTFKSFAASSLLPLIVAEESKISQSGGNTWESQLAILLALLWSVNEGVCLSMRCTCMREDTAHSSAVRDSNFCCSLSQSRNTSPHPKRVLVPDYCPNPYYS